MLGSKVSASTSTIARSRLASSASRRVPAARSVAGPVAGPSTQARTFFRHPLDNFIPRPMTVKRVGHAPVPPAARNASTVEAPLAPAAEPEINSNVFDIPADALFTASTLAEGKSAEKIDSYREALLKHGVAKIQCDFNGDMEEKSALLLDIVNTLGHADTHSATEGALWDIKNKPQGVKTNAGAQNAVAISHTNDEFSWHIDGTFEEKPTRFFGFHIIHPDKKGGGVFRLLPVQDIVDQLPNDVVDTLAARNYSITVPPEFFKGVRTVEKPLLERQPNGPTLIRYRKGLCNAPEGDKTAKSALTTLEGLLKDDKVGFAVPPEHFKENTLLLLDNRRFLHSRTAIKDEKRWLRRVRFHADSASA